MKFRRKNYILAVAMFVYSTSAFAQSLKKPIEDYKAFVDAIVDQRIEIKQQTKEISDQYKRAFGKLDPFSSQYSSVDILQYFDITYIAFFYTHSPSLLKIMESSFERIYRDGKAEEKHYEQLHGAYTTLRRLQKANEFWAEYKKIPLNRFPKVIDNFQGRPLAPKIWELNLQNGALESSTIDISSGTKIIVLVHPACHFSKNFFEELHRDQELKEYFSKNVVFLIPPDSTLRYELVRDWNRSHSNRKMVYADNRRGWPSIKIWETPVFYFYVDGKLVGSVSGWSAEGNKGAIRNIMAKIGSKK